MLLRAETSSPRLLLDVKRLHDVLHLVNDLREAGNATRLLDQVHRQLVDASWLDREDLKESLSQMRRREGTVLALRDVG